MGSSDTASRKKKSTRNRRAEKTRDRIIDAARELCVELGVEGLTMRGLAERVDYSATALYRYFKDKDELVSALHEEAWDASARFMEEAGDSETGLLDGIIAGGERLYAFSIENPADYRFMMSPVKGFPETMDALKAHPSFASLLENIGNARVAGELRFPDTVTNDIIAYLCFTVVHGAAMLRLGLFKKHAKEWDIISKKMIEAAGWMFGNHTNL